MKRLLLATTLVATLGFAVCAQAQTSPPVGGTDAKGNAPLKHAHTINDGSAKPGANSFTQGQARQHILNSGYTDVTGLTKGQDGVWRGMATHNGSQVPVAMDFKGNVTEGSAASAASSSMANQSMTTSSKMSGGQGSAPASTGGSEASTAGETHASDGGMAHHHRRRHRRHRHGACAQPGPNGAACSGVSTVRSGVSDREERALQAGAHP